MEHVGGPPPQCGGTLADARYGDRYGRADI
jgi:hypothetical protein